ncbi:MAG TPA: YkgJ family cysteine cluster protein [Azospirillaceae bacterium]|nr:YkgJ family cysteine cluster protein [Azospirillaceae bacterium]
MERRFTCTACGKCCFGALPLTLDDALAHAGRFPLAMIWTPVRQGSKAFDLTARLGITVRLPNRKQLAVQIAPTAYIPPSLPCPALNPEGRCSIHATKPSRCRTMPFYPYREEKDQADLLIPRPGWACDTSAAAAVVYRDKAIIDRADFDHERQDLLRQASALRSYAEGLMAMAPWLVQGLVQAAMKPVGGHVVVNFASFLSRLDPGEAAAFARRQHPVLTDFAELTAGEASLKEYHARYTEWAKDVALLSGPA